MTQDDWTLSIFALITYDRTQMKTAHHTTVASLFSSVGSMVAPLTGWYWVRIPVELALHPRVCKL